MGFGESITRGFDLTVEALRETIEFHRQKFMEFIKYYLVSTGIGIAGVAVALIPLAALFYIAYSSMLSGTALVAAAAVLVLISLLIMLGAASMATSAVFAAIRYVLSGKKEGYLDRKDYMPALKYVLFYGIVMGVIYAVFIGIPFALMFGSIFAGSSDSVVFGGLMAGMMMFYAGIFALIIFLYAFQIAYVYGPYEIATGRMGPVDALRRSYSLVKRNFWETLLFFVVLLAASSVVGLVLELILVPFFILAAFSVFLWVPVVLVLLLVGIVGKALVEPVYVIFWDKIRKTQGA